MATFLDDLVYLLENNSIGTQGVNIFVSSKATIPTGNGPYLTIIETGGTSPDYVQGQITPAYARPAAQLMCRGISYPAVRTMLSNALAVLCAVNNQAVNGTRYLWIHAMQEIGDRGLDQMDRATVGVNVIAQKVA